MLLVTIADIYRKLALSVSISWGSSAFKCLLDFAWQFLSLFCLVWLLW